MLDVTSCEKAASLYVFIFLIFLMFSEVLYEDEAFKHRQLSALLASKVCDSIHVQCVTVLLKVFQCLCRAANNFFLLKGHTLYFLPRHHLGRAKENFGRTCTSLKKG